MKCGCDVHEHESDSTGALWYSVNDSECRVPALEAEVAELRTALEQMIEIVAENAFVRTCDIPAVKAQIANARTLLAKGEK